MLEFLIALTGIFLLCYLVYLGVNRLSGHFQAKTTRIFRDLANAWNLEMTEAPEAFSNKWKPPILNGRLGKHPVKIFMYEKDSVEDIDTYTVVELSFPAQGTKFKLYRNHLVNKTFYGKSNVDLGDPDFEQAYILQSRQPAAARVIFSNEIRQALIARKGKAYNESLGLKNEKLVYEMCYQLVQQNQKKELSKMLNILKLMGERLDQQ